MDKKLLKNLVVHTETHNRVIEEEQCWREILHRRKEREAKEERHRSRSKRHSANSAELQRALDSYERELRREAKRRIEELASESQPAAKSSDFWVGLVKQQKASDRWGHDGWEELQRPGPPITESFISSSESRSKVIESKTPAPKLPVKYTIPLAVTEALSPTANHGLAPTSPKSHKRSKKEKKKHKKLKKPKLTEENTPPSDQLDKRKRDDSRASSISTVHSDEEIEWLERK